jgi:hypothetical protein
MVMQAPIPVEIAATINALNIGFLRILRMPSFA